MRKNLLLSSTAIASAGLLALIASPAFADTEITISGQVEFGVQAADEETLDDDAGDRGYTFFMDNETKLEAEGGTEDGLGYSGTVEFETDADIEELNVDESYLAFWGDAFGRVELGRQDGAEDSMYVGGEDFQSGTGGFDGDIANSVDFNLTKTEDAAKATYYTPRIAGFQAGASFTPDTEDDEAGIDDNGDAGDFENHFGVGANWEGSAGPMALTVSGVASLGDAEDEGEDDLESYSAGLGLEIGGFGVGAGYTIEQEFNEGDLYNVGAKFGFGPASVSAGVAVEDRDDADDEEMVYTGSADYALLEGVTLKGDVGYNEEEESTSGVVTIQFDY
jgi:outer membrane protein OmpU